jgi:hypothetical protein
MEFFFSCGKKVFSDGTRIRDARSFLKSSSANTPNDEQEGNDIFRGFQFTIQSKSS